MCHTFMLHCQGHHSHGDISHNLDVTVLFCDVTKQPRGVICSCPTAKVTIVKLTSTRNPDVMSSSGKVHAGGQYHSALLNPLDDVCM